MACFSTIVRFLGFIGFMFSVYSFSLSINVTYDCSSVFKDTHASSSVFLLRCSNNMNTILECSDMLIRMLFSSLGLASTSSWWFLTVPVVVASIGIIPRALELVEFESLTMTRTIW